MNRPNMSKTITNRLDDLINAALHKPAAQSSFSVWSQPDEAGNAVSGVPPDDFAFHTEKELCPWWRVDLGAEYPLEVIVVENRLGVCMERAQSLCLEASADGLTWSLLHAGLTVFGSRQSDDPFMLWIRGAMTARYIRLFLREEGILHLSQVEVYVKEENMAFFEYCKSNNMLGLYTHRASLRPPYIVKSNLDGPKNQIIGLDISYSARFGNLMIQYINAAVLARKTGLRYVRLGNNPLFDVRQKVRGARDRVFCRRKNRFLLTAVTYPVTSSYLIHLFRSSCRFCASPLNDERMFTEVAQEIIRPFILTGIPLPDERHPR